MYQPEFITPTCIDKVWGWQLVLKNGPDFCAKILHFNKAGNQSGYEFHPVKRELFRVLSGGFELKYKSELGEDKTVYLWKDAVVYLSNCVPHQLRAMAENSEIFEVSTPEKEGDRVCIGMGDSQRAELAQKMGDK